MRKGPEDPAGDPLRAGRAPTASIHQVPQRDRKEMANSGAYGVHAEVNAKPPKSEDQIMGDVYSDIAFEAPKVHNEQPGAFANPILASLITGGARLMLAMLEREVRDRGGSFAFRDTDSPRDQLRHGSPAGSPVLDGAATVSLAPFRSSG